MLSIRHVQKVPGCCRRPKRLHSLWSRLSGNFIVDVVNVVVSLWVVNVATLPSYCLFVVSELWFIVVSLIALVGMKLWTEKNKRRNDFQCFILLYLNDHNEIWVV